MGDRVSVFLTVLKEHSEQVIETLKDHSLNPPENAQDALVCIQIDDVNYGNIEDLGTLVKVGIPYDSAWDGYGDISPGTSTCRFTSDGECVLKDVFDSEFAVLLDALMEHINAPSELRNLILDCQKAIEILPWDNQLEYSKLYKTVQLVTPS